MSQNKNRITSISDFLTDTFLSKGFVVQRYESYTSNSIYLKLDYGVCHSIRISDHRGKPHLSYRYNVVLRGESRRDRSGKFLRLFYNESDLNSLIEDVMKDRESVTKRYSKVGYSRFMDKNFTENRNNKLGFWSGCKTLLPRTHYINE